MKKKIIAAAVSLGILTALPVNSLYALADESSVTVSSETENVQNESDLSLNLGLNEKVSLKDILDENYSSFGKVTNFHSDDENIAYYISDENNPEGVIVGSGTGTTTVTVESETGNRIVFTVNVNSAITSLDIKESSLILCKGESKTLEFTVNDGGFTYRYKFTSGNPDVVSIDSNGKITAKSTGKARIKISDYSGKFYDTCVITVKNAPSKITLNAKRIVLGTGQKYKLKYTIPAGSYSRKTVFSSDKNTVAKVYQNGTVVAKKSGVTYVRVKTHNGKSAVCKVVVKKAPSKISFRTKILSLKKGKKTVLKPSVPAGSLTGNYTFFSKNPSVAKVDSKTGKVTARKNGVAVIGVKTYNGKKAYCKIYVYSKSAVIINSSVMKSKSAWAGKTLCRIPNGASVGILGQNSRWYKVVYKNKVGYIYNKAIKNIVNYRNVDNASLPAVVDDWLFNNGTDAYRIFKYCQFSYSPMPKKSYNELCVIAWKFRTGACYHHASLLSYMLKRAGYDAHYVQGYSSTGPHAWVAVKDGNSWKHLDSTPNVAHGFYYFVPYSTMQNFGYTINSEYNKYI